MELEKIAMYNQKVHQETVDEKQNKLAEMFKKENEFIKVELKEVERIKQEEIRIDKEKKRK